MSAVRWSLDDDSSPFGSRAAASSFSWLVWECRACLSADSIWRSARGSLLGTAGSRWSDWDPSSSTGSTTCRYSGCYACGDSIGLQESTSPRRRRQTGRDKWNGNSRITLDEFRSSSWVSRWVQADSNKRTLQSNSSHKVTPFASGFLTIGYAMFKVNKVFKTKSLRLFGFKRLFETIRFIGNRIRYASRKTADALFSMENFFEHIWSRFLIKILNS